MKNLGQFRFWAIGIASVWMICLMLVPNLLVVFTSFFTRSSETTVMLPLTVNNYTRTLDWIYLQVLWNSLRMSLKAMVVCLLIGYPFAMCVAMMPKKYQPIALFMVILPFWTNSLVRTYALQFLLGDEGIINNLLMDTGLITQPIHMLYTEVAVIIGLSYILLPFMVFPLFSAIEKLDLRLHQAARDLGAGPWSRFWYITIPLTSPGIVAGCLMVLLPAMGMFFVADLLGGAGYLLLGNVIKNQFLVTRDWPFGSALSVLLIVLLGFMLWLYFKAAHFVSKKGGLGDGDF